MLGGQQLFLIQKLKCTVVKYQVICRYYQVKQKIPTTCIVFTTLLTTIVVDYTCTYNYAGEC